MIRSILCAALIGGFATVAANAQTSGTSASPAATAAARAESTGTISDHTPDIALVLNTGSGDPMHFKFSKTVNYVDASGKTLETPALRKNMRVRVSYLKEGGDMVVDKVVLLE